MSFQVVVLAGGGGLSKKLFLLVTKDLLKALLPVGNRPLISCVLELLEASNIKDLIVVVGGGDAATLIISNGRYKSVEHRGVPHFGQERLTLATFWSPAVPVVGPLKKLIDEDHPPLYRTCTYDSYAKNVVKRGLDGKNGVESYKL